MPATSVLVVSNLGAPMLRYTPHRVLAGPYHRNIEGNLAALDAFTGPVATARRDRGRERHELVALLSAATTRPEFFASSARRTDFWQRSLSRQMSRPGSSSCR